MENEILNQAEEGNVLAAGTEASGVLPDTPSEGRSKSEKRGGEEENTGADGDRDPRENDPRQEEARQTREDLEAQAAVDRIYDDWIAQGEQLKQVYPGFDLRAELQNPLFGKLIQGGVTLEAAYVALHKDEIIPAAMAAAAQAVQKKLANSIAAGGSRPSENGMGHHASAVIRTDVSALTKPDIDEVIRRVSRGERISFG